MYNPETGGLVQTQKEFTAIEGIILLQSLVPGYLQNLVSSGFLDINAKCFRETHYPPIVTCSALDLQAAPPTATVIPKAMAIMLPTVTTATTAFNAIRCRVLKDCIHDRFGCSFSHSFDRRGLSVLDAE